jgi:hypothetical protein
MDTTNIITLFTSDKNIAPFLLSFINNSKEDFTTNYCEEYTDVVNCLQNNLITDENISFMDNKIITQIIDVYNTYYLTIKDYLETEDILYNDFEVDYNFMCCQVCNEKIEMFDNVCSETCRKEYIKINSLSNYKY